MHVDDENLGENVVAQVFQAGLHAGRQGHPPFAIGTEVAN